MPCLLTRQGGGLQNKIPTRLSDFLQIQRVSIPELGFITDILGLAFPNFEEVCFSEIHDKLPGSTRMRLDALVDSESAAKETDGASDTTRSAFSLLKSDPGRIGLVSVEREITKLSRIRELDLPDELRAGVAPKLLARYRARAATESIRELRKGQRPVPPTARSSVPGTRT